MPRLRAAARAICAGLGIAGAGAAAAAAAAAAAVVDDGAAYRNSGSNEDKTRHHTGTGGES